MAKSFDEILKMATVAQSSTKQEPQKRTFDEVLKLASTKRKATSADQRQWNTFNASAQNYFNNYGTRSDYASARETSEKASADYWALAKQAEDLRFNLNMLDIDDAKKSDLLKNIEQILNGARDTKAFAEGSVSFYSSFGSQEEYDNWQKTNDLIGGYNDYENIDDAIAEIDAEIKKREPQVYTTQEKRPAGSKISSGGYNSREAMKYHPDNNPTETLSEKKAKESELELLKSQKAKLEAKKRLDERNEALKEKYVLFKGDNQFDLVADTGAKLKNPTLNKAIEYGQVDFVKNPLTFFLDNIGYGNNSFLQQFADNGNNWAKIMQKGYEQNWEELEPDEIKMYNYLLAKRGKEDAEQFLDDLKPILTERGAEADRQKRAEEWKQLNGWEKVGKNVETVLKNPINNLTAGLETIASFVVGDDAPTIEREKLSASQQVRELTAEDLTKNIDSNLWKSVVSNTYQGIMSGLDSAVGGVFLGATGYGVTAGLGAMANKASELKERGASNSQIALGAITSGLVEGLFEKVSLGYFFDKSDFSSIKSWVKTALIQGGIEASEELCTEIANIAAESIIQGYNSQNWQTINELVSNGMSLEKAQAQVSADNALGIFWAAYGGFISGGGMSITAGMPSYIANKIVDAKDNAQRIEALGQAVKKNNKGASAVVKYATEHGLKADIDLKTATVKDVGKVADSVYQYAKKKMDVGDLNASEELYAELIEGTKASTVKGIINRAFQDVVIKQFNTDRETLAKAEKKALRKASGTVKTDTVDLKKPISDFVLSRKADSTVTDADVEANRDVVSRIGKALGYEVIYDDGTVLGKANGRINFDNKTITLNTNVKNPVQWILKHEIGHFGQDTKAYADFVSKVRKTQAYADWLRAKTGTNTSVDIMEAVLNRETRKLYEDAGHKLGDTTNILTGEKKGEITEANEEIISDFIADELFSGDITNLENFLYELDKPTRNKFIQWILDIIDTIKHALTKGDKKIQAELSSLERQFTDMLKGSQKELAKTEGGGTGQSYSLDGKGKPIDTYSRIYEMQIEVNRLSREIKDIEDSGDFKTKINEIFTSNDDTETQIKKYQQLLDESNYGKLKKQRDALQVELQKLRKSFDEENSNKAREEEKAAIAKSGLSEADYFRKQAVKEFGYTPYFYDAGYITPNGKMLNFSGEKGQHYGSRGQDHRAIGIIYANTEGTDALNRFVKDGNIRIMAESPGVDISTAIEPTKEQYATIRKFVAEYANKGFFNVDLTDKSGKAIGSLEYENNINPSRILNDIKHYYATGEIRQQSNIDRFRYSLSEDSQGRELSAEQQNYFKNSKAVDENGGLKVVYHGTRNADFTVFKRNVIFFTDSKEMADSYSPNSEMFEGYVNITKPYEIDAKGEKWSKIPIDEKTADFLKEYGASVFKEGGKWRTTPADIASAIEEAVDNGDMDYDGIIINNIDDTGSYYKGEGKNLATDYIVFNSNQFKNADNKTPTSNPDIRFSITAEDDGIDREYAPTFYSRMEKIVSEMKQEKTGANSVIPYLTGRGVKAEEIKWSGIQAFLDGKKSVTKKELLDFINGSMLEIGEQMSGGDLYSVDGDSYTEAEFKEWAYEIAEDDGYERDEVSFENFGEGIVAYVGRHTEENEILSAEKEEGASRWSQYKLDGGSNYRELVFTLPNSSYSNQMMRTHWGEDAEGVLVHARIQDFDVNGKKMLFIEEIQSDYHNEGHQSGYNDIKTDAQVDKLKSIADERFFAVEDYSAEMTGNAGEWETIEKTEKGAKLLREYREAQDTYDSAMNEYVKRIPDAPFKDNYHEFVLKRLLRMAAEQGYDSIGWTPADIQSKRWSDEYAEGYRIEYDQDMPKFLNKYGRQWGAKVEKTSIAKTSVDEKERILKENELENVKRDIERAKRELARHYDSYEKAVIQRSIESMEKTVATLEQELSTSLSVWSMDITESMREAVLYEGQERFSVTDNPKIPPFKEVSAKKAKKLTVISSGARNAYNNGEMPKSAWTKNDFIIAVHEINPKLNITELSLETLKSTFLIKTGIHETGKVNKKTQFYKINGEYVKPLTQSEVFEILAKQKNILREKGVVDFTETDSASDYADKTTELYRQFNEGKITEEELNEAIDELFQQATKKYGTIEQGESVTGDEDYSHPVPERVSKETKNRRYVRTVTETGTLTKEMLRNEESAVLSGLRSFTPTSNKENLAKAMKRITNGQAEERWRAVVSGNASTHADDVALGELLLDGAIKSGDAVQALKLTAELSEVGTRLGQAVQALSLLKRMGGLGELYYVQKAVDSLNHNLDKQVGQKNHKQIKINEELALQLLETKTEAELEYAMEAIMKDIASQVPATFLEKWNAWRYMAMLANPKTLIRNFVGNAVFAPTIMIKNALATTGEMIFNPSERTKTFAVDKKYKDFATTDWERNKKLIMHGGKYSPSNAIQEYRTIFKNPVLEAVRKKYGDWMEQGDEMFIGGYYRRALSQYLAVNKVDIENIDETVLAKAQQSAMTEALKNTYRDASWLANALNSVARNSMFGQMVVEGIIPFKKTPINILKRSVEYSPIGLIHTMGKGLANLKTQNKTQKYSGSQIIDSLAGGLTGTGIMLVGMFCAKALIANFGFDDEDEWWRKMNGEQEFAIKIGDYSYTIDWMAPSVIPFFIGVSLMEQLMAENNEGAVDFLKIGASSVIEPLVQLSMLQGVQESISAMGSGESAAERWGNFATTIISNYLTQPVPTIVGKVASTMDDTSRRNYIDKNSDIPTWLQSILKKTQAKIPWFSANRTPYVNAWGEEEKTGSVWERLAENFVSPGYFSKATEDDITREITRLYKSVGDKKVLPTTPKQYFDFKNYKKYLTEQEYYEMSVSVGKKNAELIAELFQHEDYEKLSDASKVAVINDIYNWSLSCAKANLLYTFEEIQKMEIVDITEAQYNALKDSSKLAIAKEYFLNDTLWKQERKNGTVIDYLITKEIKESGKKPKNKASVDSIVKKFS